jgi:hypothetical protein
MRRMFGVLGVRGGVVVVLVLLVAGAVITAKLVDPSHEPAARPQGVVTATGTPTVDPSAGDDSEVVATPSAYPDDPDVLATATRFTTAWLHTSVGAQAWHDGVARYATSTLAQSLTGVDPAGVPARRTTGPPMLILRTAEYAQVTTPLDTGTLRLDLVLRSGTWLVDGVDWDRAS